MRCLLPILLLAAAALAGCGQSRAHPQDEKASFFGVEKYEWGNEQDQAEIRRDRPDYRPYE
jgi:hypothetical protein